MQTTMVGSVINSTHIIPPTSITSSSSASSAEEISSLSYGKPCHNSVYINPIEFMFYSNYSAWPLLETLEWAVVRPETRRDKTRPEWECNFASL